MAHQCESVVSWLSFVLCFSLKQGQPELEQLTSYVLFYSVAEFEIGDGVIRIRSTTAVLFVPAKVIICFYNERDTVAHAT